MRKLITGAVIASASLAIAGGAVAQTADEASLDVKISPTKAGTSNKPRAHSLDLNLAVTKPGTTVGVIQVELGKGLKFSGKGFKKCNIDDLIAQGPDACPSGSKAGPMGKAVAGLEPVGNNQQGSDLTLDIYPFVGANNTFYIYVDTVPYGLGIQDVLTGAITNKGRKMRISIPQVLRQPVPPVGPGTGVDATLKQIDQVFEGKAGKHGIVTSTACKNKKFKVKGTMEFSARLDANPVPSPESVSASSKCKKP